MKNFLFLSLLLITISGFGQAVSTSNLNYLYNPQNEIDLQLKLVKEHNRIAVHYTFQVATAQFTAKDYEITWQQRDSFNQREGTALTPEEIRATELVDGKKRGIIGFPLPPKPWLLVAKVHNTTTDKDWVFCKTIESNYPVNGYLNEAAGIVGKPYVSAKSEYTVYGSGSGKPIRVSFYKDAFNPASPPFAETESKVDRFLFHDSTFTVESETKLKFRKHGLYLFQEDTTAAEGFAFRCANDSYPKYSKVEDLVNPLIYVCASEEFDELKNAKGDKVKFDKVILDITRDKERAKNFMRNYFRRVELANLYFSSYKEGWKTDRGMIYLIFGQPDEVIKTGQNETWNYKSPKQSFTFVKTGSVYDPDYFVLVRERRFTETWFNTIDLWR